MQAVYNKILEGLFFVLLLLILAAFPYFLYQKYQGVRQELLQKEKDIQVLNSNIQQLGEQFQDQENRLQNMRDSLNELYRQNEQFTRQNTTQKQTIDELKHDNQNIKEWLNTDIPRDLGRLLESAETGAN